MDESPQVAYFDDLALRLVKERGIQENHYDPWGLNLVGIETEPVDRLVPYNQKPPAQPARRDQSSGGASVCFPPSTPPAGAECRRRPRLLPGRACR